ncbi:Bacteriophage tail fiber protein [Gluconobacter oxydans 621H]|uniref:Bacteriophage tail fiber protein n=1 Tax=Gluconobacter oxydans (strain 621H) TaxID=290633 RepID=Q5FNF8_GLUOX|nr:hypothetical protein [Gluconobacter oxydans]AAW62089.1 Bacteriophage tail fiber protein [Gluconobacter oxydans 621H]
MFGIDSTGAVSAMPALSSAGASGFFTGGNPSTGEQATVVTADWLNIIQSELINVLVAAGVSPTKSSLNQLALSIQIMGGIRPFNASYAAAIGGYSLGAIVSDPTTNGKYWRSTENANTTAPGSDGAAWVDFFSGYATQEQVDTYYLRKDKAPTSGTFSNGYWTKTGNILIQSFVIPSAYDGLFAAFPIAYASGTKPVVVGISGSTPDEWTSWLTAGVYPNGESSVSNTGFTLAMPKQRASSAGLVTQDNPTSARVYIMGTV